MKIIGTFFLLSLTLMMFEVCADNLEQLISKKWFSGVEQCSNDKHPAIEIYQYDADSYILRQNKCLHYEAPFIYLLFGKEKALLIDTGATENEVQFPLAKTVNSIINQRILTLNNKKVELIVAHSHSHSDHTAADKQFLSFAHLIAPNDLNAVINEFKLHQWPEKTGQLELGERNIIVIPSPGHQKEAVTFYDPKNKWLLTGDTFYPGRLYIRKWLEYRTSISRLVKFSQSHPVSGILGAHIEMSQVKGVDYPMGSQYQPNEASLVLLLADLHQLNTNLTKLWNKEQRLVLDKFIIDPVK